MGVNGYCVYEAGYYDRPQVFPNDKAVFLTTCPDEATEMVCYAEAFSKYPNSVGVRECKICTNGTRQWWEVC